MPIFTPDFVSVDASIPVYDNGPYRIQVTKKTPIVKESKDAKGNVNQQSGVRYTIEMVGMFNDKHELETEGLKGRQVSSYTVWTHTEGGWKYGKPFLMAAGGYDKKHEQEANAELFQKNTWIINGDNGAAPENIETGTGWDIPVGKLFDVRLVKKIKPNPDDPDTPFENQEFGNWAPVK